MENNKEVNVSGEWLKMRDVLTSWWFCLGLCKDKEVGDILTWIRLTIQLSSFVISIREGVPFCYARFLTISFLILIFVLRFFVWFLLVLLFFASVQFWYKDCFWEDLNAFYFLQMIFITFHSRKFLNLFFLLKKECFSTSWERVFLKMLGFAFL